MYFKKHTHIDTERERERERDDMLLVGGWGEKSWLSKNQPDHV